jgi:hypothetical protein
MKQLLITLLSIALLLQAGAQSQAPTAPYVYTIKADSVRLTACDSTELIIENHTQGIPGFLFNTGNGRTIFKRAVQKLNDSLYLIGADTLTIRQPNAWALSGNSATVDGSNFLGTTDSAPLNFRINNVSAGRIDSVNSVVELGYQAGNWNASGPATVAIGHRALQNNAGPSNTAVGALALAQNAFGNDNTAIGANALQTASNSSGNTAVGSYAMQGATGATFFNTAVGYAAMSMTQGYNNTAIGAVSLMNSTSGLNLTAVGYNSLNANMDGSDNTSVGASSLLSNTSGSGNTALGSAALNASITGSGNTAVGSQALYAGDGSGNTAVGNLAFASNTGSSNTAVGSQAAMDFNGSNNTIIGANCFSSVGFGGSSFIGDNNTIIGANIVEFNSFVSGLVIIGDGQGHRRMQVDGAGNVMFNTTTPLARNTFTGSGRFTDTLTATTLDISDSSNRVASTAWVKRQSGFGGGAFNGTLNSSLAVSGTLSAKRLLLTQSDWPDYVFDSAYRLPSLLSLENYIREHHHLPGITTAAAAKQDGVDIADNQAALLKKIEELVLYNIAQERRLNEQNEELRSMREAIDELKKIVSKNKTNSKITFK